MFRFMEFHKLAKIIITDLTEELIKVMTHNRSPDLYYSLEIRLVDSMEKAYREGYAAGKKEVLSKVELFDKTKHDIGS